MKKLIGFWGYPKPELIRQTKLEYPDCEFIDLDINFGYPDLKIAPDNYCIIIKNIINNAFFLKNKLVKILAPIGKDKCDSGYFVSEILKEKGFKVVQSIFEEKCSDITQLKLPICKSNLPLKKKIELITKNITEEKDYSYLKSTKPKFGFWGVPPNDLSILELFPNETHVFGWTRCVEAGTPADVDLEMYVRKGLPTVFYSQAFCAKSQLAKYLANKYNGLYIDVDDIASNSVFAKVEAFLRLR